MKVWVTGAGGQLGKEMVRILGKGSRAVGFTRTAWDVRDGEWTRSLLASDPPDAVVHCAAFTDVDGSEDRPREAFLTNVKGTRQLAKICGEQGIRLVYISTDYVFDGRRREGYTESYTPSPLNVYGKTKRMGERWVEFLCPDHLILRTAWVYGREGDNFPCTILRKARRGESLRVVDDQRGSPTYAVHLAEKTAQLLASPLTGVFHTAGGGDCSWYEFAGAILERAGLARTPLAPLASGELSRRAPRPPVSILRTERLPALGIAPLPDWKDGLDAFLAERAVETDD